TLQFQGGLTVAEPLTLNGTGAGGIGALDSVSGANTWSAAITMASTATVAVDGTSSLSLSGVVTLTGGLTKAGPGALTFAGASANSGSGTTTVNDGSLTLFKTGGVLQVPGNLVVGDSIGLPGTALVTVSGSTAIA